MTTKQRTLPVSIISYFLPVQPSDKKSEDFLQSSVGNVVLYWSTPLYYHF